jgi:hypothetical protein
MRTCGLPERCVGSAPFADNSAYIPFHSRVFMLESGQADRDKLKQHGVRQNHPRDASIIVRRVCCKVQSYVDQDKSEWCFRVHHGTFDVRCRVDVGAVVHRNPMDCLHDNFQHKKSQKRHTIVNWIIIYQYRARLRSARDILIGAVTASWHRRSGDAAPDASEVADVHKSGGTYYHGTTS